eukprot:gene7329-9989_t
MSESEGLQKLIEYLKQTRKQAENSIDILNDHINTLTEENKLLLHRIDDLEAEKIQSKKQFDDFQLRINNPNKFKFAERDEWKVLVESIQKDRTRLQEEVSILDAELQRYKEENLTLYNRLHEVTMECEVWKKTLEDRTSYQQQQESNESNSHITEVDSENGSLLDRFNYDSSTSTPIVEQKDFGKTPTTLTGIKDLQREFRQTICQMEEKGRLAEHERQELLQEIEQLKYELSHHDSSEHKINRNAIHNNNIPILNSQHPSKPSTHNSFENVQTYNITPKDLKIHNQSLTKPSNSFVSWISPIGLLGLLFMSNSNNSNPRLNERILRV